MSKKKGYTYIERSTIQDFPLAVMAIEGMNIDIIANDDQVWFKVGYGIANAFNESGRADFHAISKQCDTYNKKATDEKYDRCLSSQGKYNINIGFFFFILDKAFWRETGMSFMGCMRFIHS